MNVVEWAFGKRLTDKERMRKQQRSLDKMIRELDRDKVKLENESKKLITEMTKNAKAGQMGAARIQAKDLIRKRAYITKFSKIKTQLQATSLQIQVMRSTQTITESLKVASTMMRNANRKMNIPEIQRMTMEFERENDIMEQRQEIMDDAIDEATMGDEDEEEAEAEVSKICDELNIQLGQSMTDAPQGLQNNAVTDGRVAQAVGSGGGDPGDDDLQARFASLKK